MERPPAHVVEPLTERQRAVLAVIARYHAATGEACSVRFIARRLSIDPSTAQEHIEALYRKGWLRSAAPGGLRCEHV
jgi:DNA-binding MarR family transcriptional regulator